ncbi:MAG: SCO family protein [Acidobacteria bacterium]|nr:SCO family protein [Acidobacteriota bacterium]
MIRRRALLSSVILAGCTRRDELPVLSRVPAFTLTDQNGNEFRSAVLEGRPWLASLFFTSCNGPCPRLSAALFRIQEATYQFPRLRIVSFTVDPDNDSPQALAAYGRRYKADPARWTFLTGPMPVITRLSKDGFLSGAIDTERTHSTRVMLVDAAFQLRAAHTLDEQENTAPLLKDIQSLYGNS